MQTPQVFFFSHSNTVVLVINKQQQINNIFQFHSLSISLFDSIYLSCSQSTSKSSILTYTLSLYIHIHTSLQQITTKTKTSLCLFFKQEKCISTMHGCRHPWRLRPPPRETPSLASSLPSTRLSTATIPNPFIQLSNTSPSLTCQFHLQLLIFNFSFLSLNSSSIFVFFNFVFVI